MASRLAPSVIFEARYLAELLRTMPLAAAVFDREMVYLAHSAQWLPVHGEPAEPGQP